MSQSWLVSVAGRSYGPFAAEQMQAFAAERRLVPHSLTARTGEGFFSPASKDPVLAAMFAPQPSQTPSSTAQPDPQPQRCGEAEKQDLVFEPTHYIVMADMKSGSISSLEAAILNMGPAVSIAAQVWALATEKPISAVRSLLVQEVGKIDRLFVVDATHDKIAWFNYSPEAEARVRRIWAKPTPADQPQFKPATSRS